MNAWSSASGVSSESLRHLLVKSRDGVLVADLRGVVLFANPAAFHILRPQGGALVGEELDLPLPDDGTADVELPVTGMVAEVRVSRLNWKGRPARLVLLRDVTAWRRRAGSAERRLTLLNEAERLAGFGSWRYESATGRLVGSPGLARIMGRGEEVRTWLPDELAEVVHPGDRASYRQVMQDVLQGRNRAFDLEHRLQRPGGEVRVVRSAAESTVGADGRPTEVRGVVHDLTEVRRAEEERRRAHRLLEDIADNTVAAICVKDLDGRFIFSNARHAKLFGLSRERIIGMTEHDLLPTGLARALRAKDGEVLARGVAATEEQRIELPGGRTAYWLSMRFPVCDEAGRAFAVGVVSVDITEQRRAAEALRASEEVLRLVTENSQDVIFLCRFHPEPVMEYVSPVGERVFGGSVNDVLGPLERALSYVHPDDRHLLLAHWAARNPSPILLRFHRKDGTLVWIELRLVPIRNERGRVVATEGMLRDVTERVMAEQENQRLVQQLQHAERLEVLGRLAGGVAHDFNNLLAVIMGNADLLADDLSPGDPRAADVQRILDAAERGAALTQQLLIFSRQEPSTSQTIDLNEVITKISQMLRHTIGENIEFTYRLAHGPLAVTVDRTKLEQVILNLVVNAKAAMPNGGRLIVRTTGVTIPDPSTEPLVPTAGANAVAIRAGDAQATAGAIPAGEYVKLTVADTGCGMAPEVVRRAFEPFFTTRGPGEGSGLGLATVHGVVREAGGHITLVSHVGKGTTFEVYLPAVSAEARPVGGASTTAPPGRGESLLLVEDEEPVRDVLTRILTRNNYRVITTRSPVEALKICADPDTEVDALITDIIMPEMTGGRLAEQLHAATRPGVPVLYMSGYSAGQRPIDHDLEANAPVLHKPFDTDTILRRIRQVLDAPTSG